MVENPMKPGDFVKLWHVYDCHSLTSKHNSMNTVDYIHKGEVSLVLKVGVSHVKLLSPRGKIGWIWGTRVEEVE